MTGRAAIWSGTREYFCLSFLFRFSAIFVVLFLDLFNYLLFSLRFVSELSYLYYSFEDGDIFGREG